jgi:PEP-CTERM motif
LAKVYKVKARPQICILNAHVLTVFLILISDSVHSQGFINLDFEHPVLPLTSVNGQVSSLDAVPGWTTYTYGFAQTSIAYNTVSLGAAEVSLQGPGSVETIPQGSYAVILQGSTGGTPGTAAIGQTGLIPINTQSLIFWGGIGPNGVSINGQTLSLIETGSTPNYNIYAADVSSFAGQTEQLLFTAPVGFSALVDNVMFSPDPAPEPSSFALGALGTVLLGAWHWRKFTR